MRTDNPLNILYVGTLPPHRGGSAVSCAQLVLGFVKLGCRVRAIAPMTRAALDAGDSFASSHPELPLTRILVPYFEVAPNFPPAEDYRRIEAEQLDQIIPREVERERPDVVALGRESYAWHLPDLIERYNLPSLLWARGGTTAGIVNGTLPASQVARYRKQFLKADLVVAHTEAMAEHLRAFGLRRIQVIPNAVDLEQFQPRPKNAELLARLNIAFTSTVVAHISNLKDIKRPMDVVESAAGVLKARPDIVYLIVGDGPCRSAMEDACRKHGISERFRFAGWVEYKEIADYVNLADVVLMTSESESQARVYLETLGCGRVLVSSDIPGARSVIQEGKNGLLFPVGDIAALTAVTLRAVNSSGLRERIGKQARQSVQPHGVDSLVRTHCEALRKAIHLHSLRSDLSPA